MTDKPRDDQLRDYIRAFTGRRVTRITGTQFLLPLALFAISLYAISKINILLPERIATSVLLLMLATTWTGYWMLLTRLLARRARRAVAAALAHPTCVYCGYDLTGVVPDDPQTRRCPECGKPSFPLRVTNDWLRGFVLERATPDDVSSPTDSDKA